jgi:hypothetical protein
VSSGNNHHHRLNRAGNRRINRTLHIMALAQLRYEKLAYLRRLDAHTVDLSMLPAERRRFWQGCAAG